MTSKFRAVRNLLKKKLGFRYVMDVIPLDATLIKGSHGHLTDDMKDHPVLITNGDKFYNQLSANEIYDIIWESLMNNQ